VIRQFFGAVAKAFERVRSVNPATVQYEPRPERRRHAHEPGRVVTGKVITLPRKRAYNVPTGGYSGNSHDRRKARRAGLAHRWYLAHLRARSNPAQF
jgi:hypothetical protein